MIEVYEGLRAEGYLLAGDRHDLPQRASVYFHMYEVSEGRNIFPLIAAHGALWASGYFKKGMLVGRLLSLQYLLNNEKRKQQLQLLEEFADKFREINRRVCAEAYAIYHYTRLHGEGEVATNLLTHDFLEILNECHNSSKSRTVFSNKKREKLFTEFFLWEQNNIVAPLVDEAIDSFNWPLAKSIAMRPNINFAYLDGDTPLKFQQFHSKEERIAKGILAYERAEQVGFARVEDSLKEYNIMPRAFFEDSKLHFCRVKTDAYFSPRRAI